MITFHLQIKMGWKEKSSRKKLESGYGHNIKKNLTKRMVKCLSLGSLNHRRKINIALFGFNSVRRETKLAASWIIQLRFCNCTLFTTELKVLDFK